MRLKEIEQRLAAIRTELTTRGADMTDEEVATLEQEVTDLRLYGRAHLAAMLIHRIQTISIIHIPPTAKTTVPAPAAAVD